MAPQRPITDEDRRRRLLGLGQDETAQDPQDPDAARRARLLGLTQDPELETDPDAERRQRLLGLEQEPEQVPFKGGFRPPVERLPSVHDPAGGLPRLITGREEDVGPAEALNVAIGLARTFAFGDRPERPPETREEAFEAAVAGIPTLPRLFSGVEGGANIVRKLSFQNEEFQQSLDDHPVLTLAMFGLDIVDVVPLPLAAWGAARKFIAPRRAAARLADEGFEAAAGALPKVADLTQATLPMIDAALVRQITPQAVRGATRAVDEVAAARRAVGAVADDTAETFTRLAEDQLSLPGMDAQALENSYRAAEAGVVHGLPSIPTAGAALDEAAEAVIRGALPTPFAGIPISRNAMRDPIEFVGELKAALDSKMASMNMNASQRVLFHRIFHGGAKAIDDPLVLKRQLEYMAEIQAGRQHVPMTLKEARQVRKQWGPRVLEEPSGNKIISSLSTPKPGEDPVKFAFRPYATMLEDAQDVGFFRYWTGQLHKSAPEIARVLRPHLDKMYDEMGSFAARWNPTLARHGIKRGSPASLRIARLLNGEAGDIQQFVETADASGRIIPGKRVVITKFRERPVKGARAQAAGPFTVVEPERVPEALTVGAQSGGRFSESIVDLASDGLPILRPTAVHALPAEFTATEIRIAAMARMDLDNLWVRLNSVMPEGLAYNERYITFIREQYQKGGILDQDGSALLNLAPPEIIRNSGRRSWWGFSKRTSDEVPVDLDFVTSMQAYLPAALRKIHMDPAIAQLDELEAALRKVPGKRGAGLGNKLHLVQSARDYLLGTPTKVERIVDKFIAETISRPAIAKVLTTELAQRIPSVQALTSRRPSMRLSVQLSSGLYRGILAGNVSASLNNMTQSVNAMAREGVFPTIEGFQGMMRGSGRSLTGAANVQREFVKVFQEVQPGLVSWSGGRFKNMDDVLFSPFEFSEYLNRGVAFHAGFGKAIRAGANIDDAIKAGKLAANETQFIYDLLGKNMLFRGPFARQLGVLTSFPLKQVEFLREALVHDQIALARYLLVTGFASRAANANGLAIDPFESLTLNGREFLPGTSFLRQVEGAVSGQANQSLLDIAPATAILKAAGTTTLMLVGAHPDSNDPRAFNRQVQNMFSSALNAVLPASVQIQEAARVAGNIMEIQATRPEGTPLTDTETLGDVSQPTGSVPMLRDFGPRSGRLSRRSTPAEEIGRAIGLTPVRQKEQQRAFEQLNAFIMRDQGDAALANEIALFQLQQGDMDGARETLREAGVSAESFRAFRRGAPLEPLLRRFMGMSQADHADFMEQFPESYGLVRRMIQEERSRTRQ